ncbi:MAG: thiolase family protein [bacterium]|nr:thiolase family protein [bacterium]
MSQLKNTYIPYGAYWSTPFVKWQGNFAALHPLRFAADVAKRALADRAIDPGLFDGFQLGMTVPAPHSLYGAPWLAAMLGAPAVTGPVVNQVCATSARVVANAAFELEAGAANVILCITADRCSNGPQMIYPNPSSPGAKPEMEHWVFDNFGYDPYAGGSMLQTAENVARREEITTEEQHEVVLMRHAQYAHALADDRAFHKRYMVSPVEVKNERGKVTATVTDDEGVFPSTPDGLARLKPVLADGTVTYGGQTYPADGSVGLVLTTQERARDLSRDANITVQVLSFGQARAEKGYMPIAPVPAAQKALDAAGITIRDVSAIKMHDPFAVNDIYFARAMGVPLESINNYGCSLIWGHPQGPTGMRLIVELIEELALKGGGYGLFTGCAAGDTGAAVVLKVTG